MKIFIWPVCLACVVILSSTAISDVNGQASQDKALDAAEVRLRAIYEAGEFNSKRFRGNWLDDSSGYTVMESVEGSKERVRVLYDTVSGKRTVPEPSEKDNANRHERTSPDGQRVVYSDKGNLYVRDLNTDKRIALTQNTPGSPISSRQARWSPDGKWIVFVQSDASKVRIRSMITSGDPSYPEVRERRFARVGGIIPTLRVGVVDAAGSQTRWLSIPAPSEGYYLGEVSWAGNSNEVLVEKLSRFRNKREFLIADIQTGAIRCIFEESDPAWVVASFGYNLGLTWLKDGREFMVISEKDGWRHAYIYSREGKELRLLTDGQYDIIERAMVDEAGGWFYFYASPENATQKYLYRVQLAGGGELERVSPTTQPGTHHYHFSPDVKWAFHTYSTFDIPPVTELVHLPDHRVVRVLEDNQELGRKIKSISSEPTEFFQLDIGDGVVMDACMIKPSDFDPSRKYPIFVYVYGEPHGQTVLDRWNSHHANLHRVIANLGYLVVTMDNRGTPGPKGAAWRRSVFGCLGKLSTEEQAEGIKEFIRTRSYADASRVGIWGWSGGGSNTLNAMFRQPDVYHVGIAVAPKPQPHLYNAWFQEIYMETPETQPEGYQQSAPINFAEGLKGRLLIVHGTGETNTHIQITEGLVDKLIALGKRFDYMAYPHRNHGLSEGKGTSVHLRMLMVRYLMENLPAGPR